MKVLLISNMYPASDDPSYGVFVKNFESEMIVKGIKFTKAVIKGKGKGLFDKIKKYMLFIYDVYASMCKGDVDLIYVHYISHSLVPLLPIMPFMKKPLVINVHGSDLLSKKLFSRLILTLNYFSIKKSSMVVVPSNYFKDIIYRKYNHSNIVVSPSGGIDLSVFHQFKQNRSDFKGLYLGYVSRIEEQKGWMVFLRSLVILKELAPNLIFKADMVGGGSQEILLRSTVSELGLESNVNYLGAKSQNELAELFNKFDVFVFPTMFNESLGLVGIESMACGTVVIGSRIGGLTTYIEHGVNGYLFEPGNAQELASTYLKYNALNAQNKIIMESKALETAQIYKKEIVGEELAEKLYALV